MRVLFFIFLLMLMLFIGIVYTFILGAGDGERQAAGVLASSFAVATGVSLVIPESTLKNMF